MFFEFRRKILAEVIGKTEKVLYYMLIILLLVLDSLYRTHVNCFYGVRVNAIKIQIWGTLNANLLLMDMQSELKRHGASLGLP